MGSSATSAILSFRCGNRAVEAEEQERAGFLELTSVLHLVSLDRSKIGRGACYVIIP